MRNYGDHLFPAILRRAIAEFLEGAEVRLFSPSPATDYFDGTAIHAFEDLGRQNPPMDAFVIAGGDIVRFDPYPHPGPHGPPTAAYSKMLVRAAFHACASGKPLAWNAPGIPFPFTGTQKGVMEKVLASTGYISVRDPDSKDRLSFWKGPIEVVPDSGFLLSKYFPKRHLEPIQSGLRKALGLDDGYLVFHASPATTDKGQAAAAAQHVCRLAEALNLPILLLPLGPAHGDREFLAEIQQQQPGRFRLLEQDFHPLAIASLIAHAAFYVGTGLHGNITAVAYRVPCVTVNVLELSKLRHFGNLTGQPVLSAWAQLSEKVAALKAQAALSENQLNALQDQISGHLQKLLSYIGRTQPVESANETKLFELMDTVMENDRAERTDTGKLEELEELGAVNRQLEEQCRGLRARAGAQNLRLSQLLKENLRFSQENEVLTQSLAETNLLNRKLQGSLVWLPFKPFRWLEKAIRRQRKRLQAKLFPAEIEEVPPPRPPLADAANLLWEDSAVDYKRYLALCEQHGFDASNKTERDLAALPFQPLISILIP
ncbi:MAG: polysaccharide pyruvyl transferase family protein, partial [Chthoniobacter sp.]